MSNFKSSLKKAFGVGLILEVATIGGGYYCYQKYKKDEGKYGRDDGKMEQLMSGCSSSIEFRNRIQHDYPELYDAFKKLSPLYLSVLPEEWKKRILDDNPAGSTHGKQ